MAKYAANTTTPVEKSKAEIERTVTRYGATGFMSAWQGTKATLGFIIQNRQIRFTMALPSPDEDRFRYFTRGYGNKHLRTPESAREQWEQACRQKWRALALLVKAKLEAVDAGIVTLEESFFSDIVMPDGRTVYEAAREQVAVAYSTGKPVALLGAPN